MNKNRRIQFDEWARYAEEDLEMTKLALEEKGPPNQICFHAQQAAEKYLKAYIIFNNQEFEKSHQLGYLLDLCSKLDASFEELKEDVFYLTRFYIETRYPGDIPQFGINEAKKAYEATLRVKDFVMGKVKES